MKEHRFKLRDYQEKAIKELRQKIQEGRSAPLLFLATGAGKGLIISEIASSALNKGNSVLIIVKRRQIVFQTVNILKKYRDIDASMFMSDQKNNFDESNNCQVASSDTVIARIKKNKIDFLQKYNLIIIDEAHDTTSEGYKKLLSLLKNEKKLFIGLTATPFPVGKKAHTFWDCVVKPIDMYQLRDQKFLVPAKVYVPIDLDLTNIKQSNGDFDNKQLGKKMSELKVTGDIIFNYKKLGNNRPAICFCVNKGHSKFICEMFNQHDISAVHCDESTPQDERDEAIKKLKSGDVKILCNVNIFSTGVDIPNAEIGLMARPTMSEVLYIQQIGRLLRPFQICNMCNHEFDNSKICPNCKMECIKYIKQFATIIDFGDNTSRFGLPYDIREAVITEKHLEKKEDKTKKLNLTKICSTCFMTYESFYPKCPNCGDSGKKERKVKTKKGEMVLYDDIFFDEIKTFFNKLKEQEKKCGYKKAWKFIRLCQKYNSKILPYEKYLKIPKWAIDKFVL